MSTRDETRRELRELAKLAQVIPKERGSAPGRADRSSGGFTIPPAVASVPPPPLPRAARPFGSSLPVGATVQPPLTSPALAAATVASAESWVGRKVWGVIGTLGVALIAGLFLGQRLASHSPPATSATGRPAMATAGPVTAGTGPATASAAVPTATAGPATPNPGAASTPAPPASPEPTAASTTILVADPGPLTVRAPRPIHHAVVRPPPPKVVTNAASAAADTPGKGGPSAKAPATRAATAGHDSLDDFIRKSVSAN
jgi:hypothetical protein